MSFKVGTNIRHESEKITIVERSSIISRKVMPYQKINSEIWRDLEINPTNTVILVGNPIEMENAINVPHSKLIFDCVDNLSIHPQYQYFHYKKKINEGYKLVEKHADIIITVSSSLINKFPNNQVNVIRNAVSSQFIENVEKYNTNNSRNAICYFGIVQDRVNLDLLSQAQESIRLPVQIWGKIWGQNPDLLKKKYKNLEFMGEYHYTELPKLMNNAKVFVIPHHINEFSNSMDPLKLYEYLTTGKPVVSTKINSVEGLEGLIEIANDDKSFIEGIKKALNEEGNEELKKRRKEFAMANSWTSRVNQLIDLLESNY